MWLATKQGWFSITEAAYPERVKGLMQIRARDREALEALLTDHRSEFQDALEIVATPEADYPFRVYVARGTVARLMVSIVADIDYSNFKNAAAARQGAGSKFVSFLHRVWSAGLSMEARPTLAEPFLHDTAPAKGRAPKASKPAAARKPKPKGPVSGSTW